MPVLHEDRTKSYIGSVFPDHAIQHGPDFAIPLRKGNFLSMEVIKQLTADHQLILKYIRLFSRYLNNLALDNADGSFHKVAQDFLNFMTEFKLEYHQAKEENLLYIYASGNRLSSASDMITNLKEHHDHFNKMVRSMKRSLQANEVEKFTSLYEALGEEVVEHIYKEENVVFPLIEEFLPQKEKGGLTSSLQAVDLNYGYEKILQRCEKSLEVLIKISSPE